MDVVLGRESRTDAPGEGRPGTDNRVKEIMAATSKTRFVPAGEFKADCLALLYQVALTGRELIVTKRGKPFVKVAPVNDEEPSGLRGSVLYENDINSPIEEAWDTER